LIRSNHHGGNGKMKTFTMVVHSIASVRRFIDGIHNKASVRLFGEKPMKSYLNPIRPLLATVLASLVWGPAIAQSPNVPEVTPPLKIKEDTRPPVGYARPPLFVRAASTSAPRGILPARLLKFYGVPQGGGSGATIAIIDAYDNPAIASDIATFSNYFGLATPPTCGKDASGNLVLSNGCFAKIPASGSKLPKADQGWALEIALDVQWAHVVAPAANIVLIEAASNSFTDLMVAIDKAVQLKASVVSMSWGGREFQSESSYDSHFNVAGVTFFASSGDSGSGPDYPAVSPYVVSVGGTTANMAADGTYIGETAWSGSGGGFSLYEPLPAAQQPYLTGSKRGNPDVAYIADPNTGFAVYDSYGYRGQKGWFQLGGTSAGAPQWAALFAVADAQSATPLSGLGNVYNLANTSYSTVYHDITIGTNGTCGSTCTASTGYDLVTGLGSPVAQSLISALVTQP